jgi:hypothetical protein
VWKAAYCIISPTHIPTVTVGLKSEPEKPGFDYLYVRAGASKSYNLKLIPDCTLLVFIEKDGETTKSMMSILRWGRTSKELILLISLMYEEANPKSVLDAKAFIQTNLNRDLKHLIPVYPWQQHKLVYQGLKLGEFLDDWVPPDPKLIKEFEENSGHLLPDGYKQFILETNGGHLKNQVFFEATALRKPRQITSFTSFIRDGSLGTQPFEYDHFSPMCALMIGYDCRNNYLFMGLDPKIKGNVFSVRDKDELCRRDLDSVCVARMRGVHLIALSFTEFVNGLTVTDLLI